MLTVEPHSARGTESMWRGTPKAGTYAEDDAGKSIDQKAQRQLLDQKVLQQNVKLTRSMFKITCWECKKVKLEHLSINKFIYTFM